MDETALKNRIWASLGTTPDYKQQVHLSFGAFIIPSPVIIDVKVDPIVVQVIYQINLSGLNLSFIAGILLSIFITLMGYPASAWWLLLLMVVAYISILILQNSYLQKKISKGLDLPPFEGEAALWHKQKRWMQQSERCPACGELRNIYSDKCVSCGLKLPPAKGHKNIDNNASSTGDNTFKYDYKK